jgi:hypothetical protein
MLFRLDSAVSFAFEPGWTGQISPLTSPPTRNRQLWQPSSEIAAMA